jgi:hypothetical protein
LAGLVVSQITGCAMMWVDAGPNPARLKVDLTARVSKAQEQAVLERSWLTPPVRVPGGWHRVSRPLWDWGVYVVRPDGYLAPLKPESGGPTKEVPGYEIKQTAVFLAPPGAQSLRLLVWAYLEHKWYDDAGENTEPLDIQTFQEDFELNLCPGCLREISRQFGPPSGQGQ